MVNEIDIIHQQPELVDYLFDDADNTSAQEESDVLMNPWTLILETL